MQFHFWGMKITFPWSVQSKTFLASVLNDGSFQIQSGEIKFNMKHYNTNAIF